MMTNDVETEMRRAAPTMQAEAEKLGTKLRHGRDHGLGARDGREAVEVQGKGLALGDISDPPTRGLKEDAALQNGAQEDEMARHLGGKPLQPTDVWLASDLELRVGQ
jgi:hypothetical protein